MWRVSHIIQALSVRQVPDNDHTAAAAPRGVRVVLSSTLTSLSPSAPILHHNENNHLIVSGGAAPSITMGLSGALLFRPECYTCTCPPTSTDLVTAPAAFAGAFACYIGCAPTTAIGALPSALRYAECLPIEMPRVALVPWCAQGFQQLRG